MWRSPMDCKVCYDQEITLCNKLTFTLLYPKLRQLLRNIAAIVYGFSYASWHCDI